MNSKLLFLVLAVGVGACAQHPEQSAPVEANDLSAGNQAMNAPATGEPGSQDLVFLGTVTSMAPGHTGNTSKRWVVTTTVERVLSGRFSGSQFSFAIHSPAKSGLEVGKQYSIKATRTPTGYRVDEYQWRRSK
jgi:hypothetical protein